jgi:hypothetical protein
MVLLSSFGPHNTPSWTIELPEVDEDIGHTLVHYLYTGSYQTLKPQGVSGPPDNITEYRRAALVYCSARLYQLDDLAKHAIEKMQLFDEGLSIFQILDIAKDVYPKLLDEDLWLPEYLTTKVEIAFTADNTIFSTDLFMSYIGIDATFTKALVKIMDQVYRNQFASISMKKGRLKKMSLRIPLTVKLVTEELVEKFPPPQGESISYQNMTTPSRIIGSAEDNSSDVGVWKPSFSNFNFNFGFGEINGGSKDLDKNDKERAVELADTVVTEADPLPLSTLKGLPVLADGKIENLLGEVVGEVVEEDVIHAKKCFRMMYLCDENGNVKNSKGKVIARVKTLVSEKETAPELEPEPEPEASAEETKPEDPILLDISILDGLTLESDGTILDLDGKAIGELIEGDAEVIVRRKYMCNTRGEFRDRKWKVVGQARVFPVAKEELEAEILVDEEKRDEEMMKEEEAKEPEPEPEPEPELGPMVEEEPKVNKFAKLEGLRPNKSREIWDSGCNMVAKVVGGDIKKLVLRKARCDAEGNLFAKKRKVKDVTIELEEPPELEPEPTPAPIGEELVFPEPPSSTVSCEERWFEDAVLVMPPSISPNGLCPLRAQHMLGDSWENCNKCSTMIREISFQLAREEGRLNTEIDEILSR